MNSKVQAEHSTDAKAAGSMRWTGDPPCELVSSHLCLGLQCRVWGWMESEEEYEAEQGCVNAAAEANFLDVK